VEGEDRHFRPGAYATGSTLSTRCTSRTGGSSEVIASASLSMLTGPQGGVLGGLRERAAGLGHTQGLPSVCSGQGGLLELKLAAYTPGT